MDGGRIFLPGGTRQTGEDQALLVVRVVDGVGRLEPLADPVALLQRVDEHELDADLVAVGGLQAVEDLAERQELLLPADERRARQLEHSVHVVLLCWVIGQRLVSNGSSTGFHLNEGDGHKT